MSPMLSESKDDVEPEHEGVLYPEMPKFHFF